MRAKVRPDPTTGAGRGGELIMRHANRCPSTDGNLNGNVGRRSGGWSGAVRHSRTGAQCAVVMNWCARNEWR